MAKTYRFNALLTENGWLEQAVVQLDASGNIQSIGTDGVEQAESVDGYALPGFQNGHSHAFQYAMAGLSELHEGTGVPDDFWSWRTAMYDLALQVSPEHLEDIAAMLYAEMLRHGYTAVAEFHYLHHDPQGKPYANRAELGERLIAAAQRAGIHLTLVPMFYQMGGFGKAAEEKQRRFISSTIEDYHQLLESSEQAVSQYEHASLGMGIHSIRAVKAEDIQQVCQEYSGEKPFHLHISEQLKEVEDSMAFYGKRPVEWLLDNVELSEHFHLVHATHLNGREVEGIAQSGAHVVLCPTTEGNLGDGLFRFADYQAANGAWSIGTDSHVSLSPLEELRLLDYGQRLITHQRTTYYRPGQGDSGFNAIRMAWKGGRKAMGQPSDAFFKVGQPFDAVVMDAQTPLIGSSSLKHLCNTLVYASDVSHLLGTIVSGKWVVKNGQHQQKEAIVQRFLDAMADLKSRA